MKKKAKENHVRVSMWTENSELVGHVDLPPDGAVVFEVMRAVFAEFCRANKYSPETVHADFYRFCVFGEKP